MKSATVLTTLAALVSLAAADYILPTSLLVARHGDASNPLCEQGVTGVACPLFIDEVVISPAGTGSVRQTLNTGCFVDMDIGTNVKSMASLSFDRKRAVVPCWSGAVGGSLGRWVGLTIRPDGTTNASRVFNDSGLAGHSYIAAGTDGALGNWWVGTYAPGMSKVVYYRAGSSTGVQISANGVIARQFMNASGIRGMEGRLSMTVTGGSSVVSFFGSSGFATSGTNGLTPLAVYTPGPGELVESYQPTAFHFMNDRDLWVTVGSNQAQADMRQFSGLQLYRRTDASQNQFTYERTFMTPDNEPVRGVTGGNITGLGFRLFATATQSNASCVSVVWMIDPEPADADSPVWTRLLVARNTGEMFRSVIMAPVDREWGPPSLTATPSGTATASLTPTRSGTASSTGTASVTASGSATSSTTGSQGSTPSTTATGTGSRSASRSPSGAGTPAATRLPGSSASASSAVSVTGTPSSLTLNRTGDGAPASNQASGSGVAAIAGGVGGGAVVLLLGTALAYWRFGAGKAAGKPRSGARSALAAADANELNPGAFVASTAAVSGDSGALDSAAVETGGGFVTANPMKR